jgi:hypothetical protein
LYQNAVLVSNRHSIVVVFQSENAARSFPEEPELESGNSFSLSQVSNFIYAVDVLGVDCVDVLMTVLMC